MVPPGWRKRSWLKIDSALMAQLADTFPDVAPASWVFYTTPL